MPTKFKSLQRIKSFLHVGSQRRIDQTDSSSEIGCVVYRIRKGHFTILLLQNKRGLWVIPSGLPNPTEDPTATTASIMQNLTGLAELKVWQHLGQIHISTQKGLKKNLKSLDVFLMQALAESDDLSLSKDFQTGAWLSVEGVMDRLTDEDLAKMIFVAAAKIKRAQI